MSSYTPAAPAAFLGIDPASWCGWAVVDLEGELQASGTWKLGARAEHGARFRILEDALRSTIDTYQPEVVAFENVRAHTSRDRDEAGKPTGPPRFNVDAAHLYGGIVAVIQLVAYRIGVPVLRLEVGAIKQTATGAGNAKKDAMVRAAVRRWGPCVDDNEADARWIAELARLTLRPPQGSLPCIESLPPSSPSRSSSPRASRPRPRARPRSAK